MHLKQIIDWKIVFQNLESVSILGCINLKKAQPVKRSPGDAVELRGDFGQANACWCSFVQVELVIFCTQIGDLQMRNEILSLNLIGFLKIPFVLVPPGLISVAQIC